MSHVLFYQSGHAREAGDTVLWASGHIVAAGPPTDWFGLLPDMRHCTAVIP